MREHSREWWEERIDLIKAFIDGKEIYCDSHILNLIAFDLDISYYKIKPKTISVSGFEVPEPVNSELDMGYVYYIPVPSSYNYYCECHWEDHLVNNIHLERGLVHLTKENAIAHAKAMLGIDPNA